jgi:hypothetical protein
MWMDGRMVFKYEREWLLKNGPNKKKEKKKEFAHKNKFLGREVTIWPTHVRQRIWNFHTFLSCLDNLHNLLVVVKQ